jgi:ABC-type glycerol-3-phosphate transport system permease component
MATVTGYRHRSSPAVVARRASLRSLFLLVMALLALFCAFPFIWATITMFKANADLYNPAHNPFLFNQPATLAHLLLLFQQTPFLTFVKNSALVGGAVTGLTLLGSIPAAYALARLIPAWGDKLGVAIFMVYLVPPTLLFLPLSHVVATLRLQDNLWSLVVVYPSFTIPLSIWLLMGFFKSIPRDIIEQAQVDGCSLIGALVRVVMPLAVPGIITVMVFSFTLTTQDFIYALAFISSSDQMTISVGVPTNLIRGDVFYWQSLMAATVIVAVPIALVYNVFLRRFIQGFTMGALKG